MKTVYDFFFHRKKREAGCERKDNIMHILAPSMLGMCICAICLCGASWAWFTASTGSIMQVITTPQYDLSIKVTDGANEINGTSSDEGTKYTLTGGTTYTVTLSATGTERATGYCVVRIGGTTYYSDQIFAVSEFTFTVKAGKDGEMTITTNWGTCALEIQDKIKQDSVINTANMD